MDGARVIEKMYYIVDGRGNYYRANEEDQLIVSRDKESAGLFELKEANKHINSGRKMYFYSILPADKKEEEPMEQLYQYDLEQLDWKEYLLHFSYVVSGLKKYQDKLNQELSEVDMCICDLMHYLELYDLDEADCIKAAGLIKQYREKRRFIKDKAHMAECFQKTIGTDINQMKAKEALSLINKLDRRTYKPRVLTEIFTNDLIKTERKEQLVEAGEMHSGENGENIEVMESLERIETAFDNGENNWSRLVAEQAAFFTDAKQYICNLQITLNELDEEIEQTLYQIEEANYNVAQGYKVFKQLKDLRNERKEVAKELECVQTITQCFDCEAMRDAYRYCEDRIREII